jgi:hypothetical protein
MFSEADVQTVITHALSRGRELDRFDACAFLRSKELLASDPEHEAAKSVVESMMHFFATGEMANNFHRFVLGPCETREEVMAAEALAASHRNAVLHQTAAQQI